MLLKYVRRPSPVPTGKSSRPRFAWGKAIYYQRIQHGLELVGALYCLSAWARSVPVDGLPLASLGLYGIAQYEKRVGEERLLGKTSVCAPPDALCESPFPTSVVNTSARWAATLGHGGRDLLGALGEIQFLTQDG
jgi:hypothetical protein